MATSLNFTEQSDIADDSRVYPPWFKVLCAMISGIIHQGNLAYSVQAASAIHNKISK